MRQAVLTLGSVGIPTYFYGHEPSNRFCSFHAKFFSNATREEALLDICEGGLVVTPGGPGTLQEIFQACCRVAYGKKYPIVFQNVSYWTDNGVFAVVSAQAQAYDFHHFLAIFDSVQDIVDFLVKKSDERAFCRMTSPRRELSQPHWYSKKKTELTDE